jgi:hypothetical protein
MNNSPYIGSSEFKQWVFCPRHWYLLRTTGKRAQGPQIPTVRRGVEYHTAKSREVINVQKKQSAFVTAAVLGGIACIIWLLS